VDNVGAILEGKATYHDSYCIERDEIKKREPRRLNEGKRARISRNGEMWKPVVVLAVLFSCKV